MRLIRCLLFIELGSSGCFFCSKKRKNKHINTDLIRNPEQLNSVQHCLVELVNDPSLQPGELVPGFAFSGLFSNVLVSRIREYPSIDMGIAVSFYLRPRPGPRVFVFSTNSLEYLSLKVKLTLLLREGWIMPLVEVETTDEHRNLREILETIYTQKINSVFSKYFTDSVEISDRATATSGTATTPVSDYQRMIASMISALKFPRKSFELPGSQVRIDFLGLQGEDFKPIVCSEDSRQLLCNLKLGSRTMLFLSDPARPSESISIAFIERAEISVFVFPLLKTRPFVAVSLTHFSTRGLPDAQLQLAVKDAFDRFIVGDIRQLIAVAFLSS